MQPNSPNDGSHAFRAKLDGELQVLFQSLSAEWENTLKDRNEEDLDAFMAKWVEGVRDFFEKRRILFQESKRPARLPSESKYSKPGRNGCDVANDWETA